MGLYFNITACVLALMLMAFNYRFNKSAVYLGISLFSLNFNVGAISARNSTKIGAWATLINTIQIVN